MSLPLEPAYKVISCFSKLCSFKFTICAAYAEVVNVRFGGYTEGIDRFDGACFGIKRGEALLLDPQQRSLLEGVLEAKMGASSSAFAAAHDPLLPGGAVQVGIQLRPIA